jgi:hypothetical protein
MAEFKAMTLILHPRQAPNDRNWPISEATATGRCVCLLRVHPPPECRGR